MKKGKRNRCVRAWVWGGVAILLCLYLYFGVPRYWLHQWQQTGTPEVDYIQYSGGGRVYPFLCSAGPCKGKADCDEYLKTLELCTDNCNFVPEGEDEITFNQRIVTQAKEGDLASQYLAYKLNFLGIGQEPDALQAFYWLDAATSNGVMKAVLSTVGYRMKCTEDPYGKRDALHYLTWEVVKDKEVGFSLAIDYKFGSELVEQNWEKSFDYFTQLADLGVVRANLHLALA